MQKPSYARYRFPPVIIRHAVWLYFRFPLSYRDVEDMLAERGHCQSKFGYFAKTSEPDFAAIDFPAFFRVDLSGSMVALSI
jgi:hypothetical protein